MSRLVTRALAVVAVLATVGCVEEAPAATVDWSVSADPALPVAAVSGQVEAAIAGGSTFASIDPAVGGPVGESASLACEQDLATMQVAVETYRAMHGRLPTSEGDLVDGGVLVAPSPRWDLDADAEVVAQPGSGC